jgi:F420-dependent oxidoreductase-like protein
MRIGVFTVDINGGRTTVPELLAASEDAERRGFATAWVPQLPWSLDALAAQALAATATERIELGTAVLPTYPRHPLSLAQGALTIQAASNGRFALGIGPSHPVIIEAMYGLSYDSPAAHTAEYVQVLRNAAESTGHVAFGGSHFAVNAIFEVPAGRPFPILIGALGPRMLEVAGGLADGTITTWCDERAIGEHIAPKVTAAAKRAGRPSPRIVCCLSVAVVEDADAARQEVAPLFAGFPRIPAYQRMFELATNPDPVNVAVVGDERTVRARFAAFESAGVTDFCAAPMAIGPDPAAARDRTLDLLQTLVG